MKDEIHTTEAFRYLWRVWKWSGFKVPPRGSLWRIPYIVYALLLHLLVDVTVLASLIINCCLSKNIAECCWSFYVAITELSYCLKLINVYLARHELEKVDLILKDLDLRAVTPGERTALRDANNSAKKWFIYCLHLFLMSLVAGVLVVGFSQERVLIFPGWFPWDWQSSRGAFLITIFCQLFTFSVQIIQNLCNDTYPQAYMLILASHMRALAIRIQALGEQGQERGPVCAEEQQHAYEMLIQCIKDHQKIESLFLIIRKPISRTSLIQFVSTGVAQCTVGINILYVGIDITQLVLFAVFLVVVTLETLILCYFAEMVCEECVNLENAIYSCNWIDQNEKFKRALLFLLQRTQRTYIIKAGNVVPIGLPTFVKVVRVAYSVFAVLNKIK